MRFFDPHIHMTSRTTDDYDAMAKAGILDAIVGELASFIRPLMNGAGRKDART